MMAFLILFGYSQKISDKFSTLETTEKKNKRYFGKVIFQKLGENLKNKILIKSCIYRGFFNMQKIEDKFEALIPKVINFLFINKFKNILKNVYYFRSYILITYIQNKIIYDFILLIVISLLLKNPNVYASLYDEMNDPMPHSYSVMEKDGSRITYHSDGTITSKFSIIEVNVKELTPGHPGSYQNKDHPEYPQYTASGYATSVIDATKVLTADGQLLDGNDFTDNTATYLKHPDIILQDYMAVFYDKNDQLLVKQSLMFVDNLLPPEMFAKNDKDIKDPDSLINKWVDNLNNADLTDEANIVILCHLKTAVATLNTCKVLGLDINDNNLPLIQKVFTQTFKLLLSTGD